MELEEKNRKHEKKATSTDDRVLYANAIVVVKKRPQKRPLLLLLSLRLNVVLPFLAKVSFPLVLLHCTALFQTSLGLLLSCLKFRLPGTTFMYLHNILLGK